MCGKRKVKHIPFSGPRAPWLRQCLGSWPGCYGNSKAPRKPWLPFPEVPVLFSLLALFPSPLPVPSWLAPCLIQIASCHHLLLPHCSSASPFPLCPQRPIFLPYRASLCSSPPSPSCLCLTPPLCSAALPAGALGRQRGLLIVLMLPMPPPASLPCGLRKPGLASCSEWVPGSGTAAGALASGGSGDGVYGQPARRERSGAVVCRGGASTESAPGELPLPHVAPAAVARAAGGQVPSEGRTCAPALCPAPSWAWGLYCTPLKAFCRLVVAPINPVRWAGRAVVPLFAEEKEVLCSCLPPRPLLFPLHGLWLVKVWDWDPKFPPLSLCPLTCHPLAECDVSLRFCQSFLLLLKKCQWKEPYAGCLHVRTSTRTHACTRARPALALSPLPTCLVHRRPTLTLWGPSEALCPGPMCLSSQVGAGSRGWG